MIYFLAYPALIVAMRLLLRVLGRICSAGQQNVPRQGGMIYCSNHLSDCDPVAIVVTAPRRCWIIGKSELFQIPILGWWFARLHAFPIQRDSADRAALRRAEALLKSGEALLLFPEGRLSENGLLQQLQPGAALLSLRTGAPIVPIGLRNTDKIIPYGSLYPRYSHTPVHVIYGKPIAPESFASLPRRQAIEAMTDQLAAELLQLAGQETSTLPGTFA